MNDLIVIYVNLSETTWMERQGGGGGYKLILGIESWGK